MIDLEESVIVFHKRVAPRSAVLLNHVYRFAYFAHLGQERKYNLGPYIQHPVAVARLVGNAFPDAEMIAAAYLHDVVEDTPITVKDIATKFDHSIAAIVQELTDVSKPEDGNRAVRKTIDRIHLSKASPRAKAVKCADLIDNTKSIIKYDPGFARIYMAEKRLLLKHLSDAVCPELYAEALRLTEEYEGDRKDASNMD